MAQGERAAAPAAAARAAAASPAAPAAAGAERGPGRDATQQHGQGTGCRPRPGGLLLQARRGCHLPFSVSVDVQVMNKPLASGAYVLNKVPVKRRLGAAGGTQAELGQAGAVVEDSQVRLQTLRPSLDCSEGFDLLAEKELANRTWELFPTGSVSFH